MDSSMIKETLKTLCCRNGWSYAIFWGFNQINSLLLTLKDAYYEDQMSDLIDNMLLQLHFLGRGVIGQAAFTKTHRWMYSDSCLERTNLEGFEDDSNLHWQFSMGIKAIALIPVEPWGVVQLGSTQKVLESNDFIDQVKVTFNGLGKNHKLELPTSSSSSNQCFSLGEVPLSTIEDFKHCKNVESVMEASYSLDIPTQLFPSYLDHQNTNPLITDENGIQIGCKPTLSPLELLLSEFGSPFDCSSNQAKTKNSDFSVLTSSWPQIPSGLGPTVMSSLSTDLFSKDIWNTQSSTLLSNPTDFRGESGSGLFTLDELLQESAVATDGLIPLSSLSGRNSAMNVSEKLSTYSMQSSVSDALRSSGEDKFHSIDRRLLNNSGVEPGCEKPQAWDELMIPILSGGAFETSNIYGCKKFEPKIGTTSNSLFSRLGLDQILDGSASSSSSFAKSRFEDSLSSAAKRRKIDSYSWSHDSEARDDNSGTSLKEAGFCIGDNSSLGAGSTTSSKKLHESAKTGKKKAKPGTRPRPKDRQMIQDRLAELRGLIPNGEKMSIDRLLERTIRHLNFMSSLAKHTECQKQVDKAKTENAQRRYSSSDGGGVTWACEFADQSMVCPLIVEDLSTPGQMLIEILYEECGFFLEMVDVIRNFGLIILKGVMEIRETKIWAHFIVEAKGDRHGMRHEIFSSLIQLLQMTDHGAANTTNKQFANTFSSATPLFNNCQSVVPFSVNMADTIQCANL